MDELLKCTICDLEKPIEEFEIDARRTKRFGRSSRCKSCHTKASIESRQEKKLAELEAAWRELLGIPPEKKVFHD